MNRLVLALGLACMACEAKQPLPPSSLGGSAAAGPAPALGGPAPSARSEERAAPAASTVAASPDYYTLEELRGLGLGVSPLGDGSALVCGSEAGGQCLCLMPLDCTSGGCVRYSENVAAFETALAHPSPGTKVQCDAAAVGDCGHFKYFNFQGDLYRREVRWFDASGALVGQRDVTDYAAYCGKQTRARFVGQIPKCDAATERKLICGETPKTVSPIEDVRRFTAPRAKPTGTPPR